ncbi:MAG: PKD domain-containing protein [Saprospiraceae bacterium]
MRCWILLFIFTFCSQSFLYSQCSFTVPGTNFCGGENINFTVNNPTGSIYTWDFDGDGMGDATGISVGYAFPALFTNQSYFVSLLENGIACETQNISILAVPDASIGLVPSGVAVMNGTNINACSGAPEVSIAIFNTTTTTSINTKYEINWGDGSLPETYTNANFPSTTSISHDYTGFGYKTLSVTVTANNGCTSTTNYTFYNGGNPSIGLGNPGNTVGLCAPATIVFPISDYEDNPVGTIYEVFVNDVLVDNLTQATIEDEYSYTFTGTSCGETTSNGDFEHAFDLKIRASNPCGSTAATVEPIELSSSPQASFQVQEPVNSCPGETWVFTDNSLGVNEVISGNPTICENELLPSWSITPNQPGVLWNLISGNLFSSEAIEVVFLQSGSYTITMTLNSIACGPSEYTETIFVLEPPTADADLADASDDCVPATVSFNNLSAGFQMNYTWAVNPPTGWNFTGGTDENSENPIFVFSVAGSYEVSLLTANICAEDTWDTTLVFLAPPTISLDSAPDECQTATLNFDASNLSYNANGGTISNYSWSFPGATPATSTAAFPTGIQYNGAGTYIYSVTAVGAACGPTTVSDTFTVIDPVQLTLPDDLTVCVDDAPVNLTASHSPGIWSGNGVTAAGIFDPSLAMLGENILTYTFGNGLCTSTESISIFVNALPAILLSANNETSACISETTIALTATPAAGTWTASNGGVLTGNVFNPSASGVGSYTLTYSYTDPVTNCENSANFIFTVLPLPQITVSDTSYCDAVGLVELPFASPTGGTWSGTGLENGQFNPQGTGVGAMNELIYTYTDNEGCTNTATVIVTITNPVTVDAGPDVSLCQNVLAYNLNDFATPTTGTWDDNGQPGLSGSIFNPSVVPAGSYTFTLRVGTGNCEVEDELTITVLALPTIIIDNNETSACISETSIPLTASPTGGIWTVNNSGVLDGNVLNPSSSGAGNYSLTYSYTDPVTNCTHSESFLFTVFPLPEITVSDTSYCDAAGLVDLPFASPAGGTWSGSGVESGQFNPQGTGVGATNELSYTYTDNNGCINTALVTITITNPAVVNAGPDVSLCQDILTYDLNDFASPTTGVWDDNGQPGLIGSIFNPSIVPAGSYTFTLRVGVGNCEVEDEVTITVLALPTINIENNETSACILETSIVLNAFPDAGIWSVNNGGVLNGNVFNPSTSGIGEYILTYSYTDPNTGCMNSDNYTFIVNPLPQIIVNDTTYCNAPGLVELPFATPVGGTWSGDGVENGQFNPQGTNVSATNVLTYTYTDGSGCTDSETITISIIELAVIEAGVDDTLCVDQGLYTIPDFLPTTGGIWSGNGIINASEGIFNPVLAGGGVHTLYYRYGTGNCLVEDSIRLTVIAIALSVGAEEDVCITAEPFSLSGNTVENGIWTINGIATDTFDPAALGLGEQLVSYTLVDEGSGCVFEDSKTITVQPLANSSFTAPTIACIGETVSFANTSNNTFDAYWTFGDGEDDEEVSPNHVFETTGFYTVTLVTETEFGCLDTFMQSIFIEAPPQPSFDFTISRSCEGITVYLSDSIIDGTSYELDYGIGNTNNEWLDSIFYPGGEDTLVYTISLTSINLCGSTSFTHPTEIIVPPAFNANFGILPLDNHVNTYCSPETIEFANISTGEIDSFTVDYGNGNFSTNEFIDQIYENSTDSLVSYTITMIIYGPYCPPDTATQEISLFPIFFQTAFNVADTLLCENVPLVFTNFTTPYPGIEYYEFDMGDGTIVVLNEEELDDFEYAYENSGSYTIELLASDGCSESSYSIDVTVVAAPSFELNLQDFGCTGEEVIFAATEADSMTAFIFEINGDTVSVLPDFRYVFDAPATYYVKVTAENPLTECVTILMDSIKINENLGFPLLASKDLACEVLELSFTNAEISYVDWGDGDFIDAPGMNVSHPYAEAGVYFVEIVHADAFGCEYKEAHTVEVMENDLEVVAYDPITINLGETAELGATVTGTGPFSYRWEPADQVVAMKERETDTEILLDHTVFTIYVENANACIDTAKMNVRVRNKQRLYIPNVFSPNGDNINDRFEIFGGPEVLWVKQFSIFDRFGDQVYGLNTPTLIDAVEAWDGRLKGKVLDPGVFAYFIEVEYINGEVESFKGDVTLLR